MQGHVFFMLTAVEPRSAIVLPGPARPAWHNSDPRAAQALPSSPAFSPPIRRRSTEPVGSSAVATGSAPAGFDALGGDQTRSRRLLQSRGVGSDEFRKNLPYRLDPTIIPLVAGMVMTENAAAVDRVARCVSFCR